MSLSLEEVAVHAGHKVLMEVDKIGVAIVGDSQGILGKRSSLAQSNY
jgi:hypothetical protein